MPILSKEKRKRENTKRLLEAQAELLLAAKEATLVFHAIRLTLETATPAKTDETVKVIQARLQAATFAVDEAIREIKADPMVRR